MLKIQGLVWKWRYNSAIFNARFSLAHNQKHTMTVKTYTDAECSFAAFR